MQIGVDRRDHGEGKCEPATHGAAEHSSEDQDLEGGDTLECEPDLTQRRDRSAKEMKA